MLTIRHAAPKASTTTHRRRSRSNDRPAIRHGESPGPSSCTRTQHSTSCSEQLDDDDRPLSMACVAVWERGRGDDEQGSGDKGRTHDGGRRQRIGRVPRSPALDTSCRRTGGGPGSEGPRSVHPTLQLGDWRFGRAGDAARPRSICCVTTWRTGKEEQSD